MAFGTALLHQAELAPIKFEMRQDGALAFLYHVDAAAWRAVLLWLLVGLVGPA